ncbi:hypothetical protein GCM10022254_22560 [Actinomadura meridiana]|uniref:Dihydroneopterin aldolase/epimerase domain-containing protein n=1 Tax=Actinomadura meridiana TaxID=559626 RepID=A0ABP8BXW6_9ACTN
MAASDDLADTIDYAAVWEEIKKLVENESFAIIERLADQIAHRAQIDEQLTEAQRLPDGPLRLHIGFVVGPRRNWPNLWKPTIDALGKLLGGTTPDRPWHPSDGRIVQLGLSTRTDPTFGNHITLRIHAGPSSADPT